MTKEKNVLKDLGLVTMNDNQLLWDKVVNNGKELLKRLEEDVIVNKKIVEMAESELKNASA